MHMLYQLNTYGSRHSSQYANYIKLKTSLSIKGSKISFSSNFFAKGLFKLGGTSDNFGYYFDILYFVRCT